MPGIWSASSRTSPPTTIPREATQRWRVTRRQASPADVRRLGPNSTSYGGSLTAGDWSNSRWRRDEEFETHTYTHTALHELGHTTGHPSRLNRPTLVDHGGFGSETYAKEELRAEIAAMMTGEKLSVGHEPRHGTAYVSSWVKALQNDPREIRAAAVDAQKISDWLMARERERTAEQEPPSTEPANREDAMAPTPEREAMAVRVGNGGERAEEARGRTAAPQRDAGPSR